MFVAVKVKASLPFPMTRRMTTLIVYDEKVGASVVSVTVKFKASLLSPRMHRICFI